MKKNKIQILDKETQKIPAKDIIYNALENNCVNMHLYFQVEVLCQ